MLGYRMGLDNMAKEDELYRRRHFQNLMLDIFKEEGTVVCNVAGCCCVLE